MLRRLPRSYKVEGYFSNEVYHATNLPKSSFSNISVCSKITNEKKRTSQIKK